MGTAQTCYLPILWGTEGCNWRVLVWPGPHASSALGYTGKRCQGVTGAASPAHGCGSVPPRWLSWGTPRPPAQRGRSWEPGGTGTRRRQLEESKPRFTAERDFLLPRRCQRDSRPPLIHPPGLSPRCAGTARGTPGLQPPAPPGMSRSIPRAAAAGARASGGPGGTMGCGGSVRGHRADLSPPPPRLPGTAAPGQSLSRQFGGFGVPRVPQKGCGGGGGFGPAGSSATPALERGGRFEATGDSEQDSSGGIEQQRPAGCPLHGWPGAAPRSRGVTAGLHPGARREPGRLGGGSGEPGELGGGSGWDPGGGMQRELGVPLPRGPDTTCRPPPTTTSSLI